MKCQDCGKLIDGWDSTMYRLCTSCLGKCEARDSATRETHYSKSGMSVKVAAWSGNVRPWQARVYDATGRFVGKTGFARSKSNALMAADRLIAKREGR